jgi:hypothetical protein
MNSMKVTQGDSLIFSRMNSKNQLGNQKSTMIFILWNCHSLVFLLASNFRFPNSTAYALGLILFPSRIQKKISYCRFGGFSWHIACLDNTVKTYHGESPSGKDNVEHKIYGWYSYYEAVKKWPYFYSTLYFVSILKNCFTTSDKIQK